MIVIVLKNDLLSFFLYFYSTLDPFCMHLPIILWVVVVYHGCLCSGGGGGKVVMTVELSQGTSGDQARTQRLVKHASRSHIRLAQDSDDICVYIRHTNMSDVV